MAKAKKELLESAPWRVGPQESDEKFKDARMKVTSQPGTTPTMHVPGKKKFASKNDDVGEDSFTEIDPELRYSFHRNFQSLIMLFLDEPGATFVVHSTPLDEMEGGWSKEQPPILRYIRWSEMDQFLQRVFSIDTIVKPLPPAMAYNASRNLTFFTRIFTQFFDPDGIADAQKSLGLGQEKKVRNVR